MSIATSPELLQKMRDNKEVRNTAHPMDRLLLLKTFAERDYVPNTANLIEALLTIIDGMHTRICDLEEKLDPQKGMTLITKDGIKELPLMGKDEVAGCLLDEIAARR